jgi:hypothetical protein
LLRRSSAQYKARIKTPFFPFNCRRSGINRFRIKHDGQTNFRGTDVTNNPSVTTPIRRETNYAPHAARPDDESDSHGCKHPPSCEICNKALSRVIDARQAKPQKSGPHGCAIGVRCAIIANDPMADSSFQ